MYVGKVHYTCMLLKVHYTCMLLWQIYACVRNEGPYNKYQNMF